MKISDLAVSTKTAVVDFPGVPGFKVKVNAVSRELSRKIRKDSTIQKFEPGLRQPIEEVDAELFSKVFTRAAISGWEGLTVGGLTKLLLIDGSKADNLDAPVEYSEENAIYLMKNSTYFEQFINEVVFGLDSFR